MTHILALMKIHITRWYCFSLTFLLTCFLLWFTATCSCRKWKIEGIAYSQALPKIDLYSLLFTISNKMSILSSAPWLPVLHPVLHPVIRLKHAPHHGKITLCPSFIHLLHIDLMQLWCCFYPFFPVMLAPFQDFFSWDTTVAGYNRIDIQGGRHIWHFCFNV